MKKKLLLMALLAILMLALVACTGDTTEPNADNINATDAPDTDDTDDADTGELECDDEIGCVEVAPGDPIRIASALVITGADSQLGLDSQYGVELAIDAYGDIAGHPVELQREDDGCSAEGGQAAAQKIVADPTIVGVIGTSCSGAGVPASSIISDAGYVMISPSNTAPVLTDAETHEPGYLRTAHNDKVQGRAMAVFAYNELGLTRAAAIHDGDPYTEGLASVFRDSFEELGGEIVAFEAVDRNADDVTPVLRTIATAGPPEFIYYPVFTTLGANITKQAKEVDGLEGVVLAGADGIQSPDFLSAAGEAAEGMYVSGPDLGFANSLYDTMLANYQEKYGSEPLSVFHAHAYDATNMLLQAIESVAIEGDDGTLLIPRAALREALFATSGFEGITGTLTCDEFGDCADPRIAVSQVVNGEFSPVWSDEE